MRLALTRDYALYNVCHNVLYSFSKKNNFLHTHTAHCSGDRNRPIFSQPAGVFSCGVF